MAKADSVLSTPRETAPKSSLTTPEQSLHARLKAAGMRLVAQSGGPDRYLILWRHQCVVRDLTLLEAARFIDHALVRR
jgi:hypothetical protein